MEPLEHEDGFLCAGGRKLLFARSSSKKENGSITTTDYYRCKDCSGCELRSKCFKSSDEVKNKEIRMCTESAEHRKIETVKAEMNGLTPGLDRSPPPRWMGGQGGQSLKVFGRTRSFWGLSSPKIEMGGKALKWLSRLDYPLAKTGETVNGGAESAVHLDR